MILSIDSIIALIQQYGYLVIFPVSIIEGPIIAVISGFLVSLGYLNAAVVFLVLLLGDFVGDTFYYFLGRWGGTRILHKWGKRLGFKEKHIQDGIQYFHTRGGKILLVSKLQAIGSVVLFSAGAARMHYGKFIAYNMIGSLPKVLIFEAIGIYGGASFTVVNQYINTFGAIVTASTVILLALWIWWRQYARPKKGSAGEGVHNSDTPADTME